MGIMLPGRHATRTSETKQNRKYNSGKIVYARDEVEVGKEKNGCDTTTS